MNPKFTKAIRLLHISTPLLDDQEDDTSASKPMVSGWKRRSSTAIVRGADVANNVITAVASATAIAAGAGAVATLGTSTTSTKVVATAGQVTDADASRLAAQATFGPTPAVVARIKALGVNGWLDEQFSLKQSSFADLAAKSVNNPFCDVNMPTNKDCFRLYRDYQLPAMRFYKNAVENDDQLRQRVALALFNIMPVSGLKSPNTASLARYQQIMLDNAFGNYATLLRDVVMSGAMASYLDHAGSTMAAPNENLARELLQLFTIGVNKINKDGTPVKDKDGADVANYTGKDVSEVARALTGWTYARFPGAKPTDTNNNDLAKPLIANPAAFDSGVKRYLGSTIPAGLSQDANIDHVIGRLMRDPSIGPRISKLLIQALVKSNPSPAYISRVVTVFRDNGSGTAGDLRATVRAILTDSEARTPDFTVRGGKLKDPILLLTSVGRLTGMKTDGYAFTVRDVQMGQQFLRTPSIFGDYPPDFPLPGNATLVSPPSKLMTVGTILERHNFVWQWTISGDDARPEYQTPAWVPDRTNSVEDWSSWEAFGSDVKGMVDRINLLMLANTMTADQRAALTKAMTLVTNTSPTLQARRRAQTGLFIVASSPQFQIDR